MKSTSPKKTPAGHVWMRLNVCGQAWEVRLADEEDFRGDDGEELDGLTLPSEGIIYIDVDLPESHRMFTLWHELMHAVFSSTGLDDVLKEHLPDPTAWEKLEEMFCASVVPALIDTLDRNGLTRLIGWRSP